jgi:hypothetical protein
LRGGGKRGVERLERLERFEPVYDLAICSLTICSHSPYTLKSGYGSCHIAWKPSVRLALATS